MLNSTKESVEVSFPWRRACARKSGRGCCPCKAANKNCKASCQCRWHSCNEVTKRPAAGHGLKITIRPAVRYFLKIFIRKCSTFIFNPEALPGSQKIRTWCFSPTPNTECSTIKIELHLIWNIVRVPLHWWWEKGMEILHYFKSFDTKNYNNQVDHFLFLLAISSK